MSTCCCGKKVLSYLFVLLSLTFVYALSSIAQGTAGRIAGSVSDQTGGAIVGATVTITDVQRNVSRTLKTDDSGQYNAPNLLPSTYLVRGEANGFKAVERPNVVLEVGGDVRVDLQLQPGDVTQTVTVTEAVPLVETTNGQLGGTLQSQAIEDLPLNGRNFENLLQLRPGVTIFPGGTSYSQSTNGLRAKDNTYMVNGIEATDPWMGQSVMNAVLNAGDAGTILSVDAIDEFKTEENPEAEFGWRPGAVVNVGVKSGTNTLHGTAFAFGRDTALDALNYFDAPPAPKAPVTLEQFGGTVGGPIKKDKLFYFGDFESQLYTIGNPEQRNFAITSGTAGAANNNLIDACLAAASSTTTPLTALSAEMAGLSYNAATLKTATPTGSCNPLSGQPAGGFQGFFPVNPGPSTAIFSAVPNNNTIRGGLGKIDYHLNDRNSFQGMYFFSQGDGVVAGSPQRDIATQWLTQQHARAQTASGSWTWTPNSTWVNELRAGYTHYYQYYFANDHTMNPEDYTFNGATYDVPTGVSNPFYYGLPLITVTALADYSGIGNSWPKIVGPDSTIEILDHISVLRGKHAFKFGGEIHADQSTNDITSSVKGPAVFTTYTNFFEGTPSSASLQTGNPLRHLSSTGYALFIQDDWRLKPRLTLNLGVRYELSTVVKDRDNLLGNFDPVRGLEQVGDGITAPYNGDHNNFAPRLGFAYDVFGDGKTVIRGAGSIVYESVISFDTITGIGNLYGLGTIPTGLPLFNNASTTSLPVTGNITDAAVTYTGAGLTPIETAWRTFNPALPVGGSNQVLYAGAASPACGDGFTLPPGYTKAPAACSVIGINPDIRTPYVENWNLGVQRAITQNVSLDVEYVGNHGTKLYGKLDENQPQYINGFSPGWGNPAVAGTAAALCLASAPLYSNCGQSGTTSATLISNGEQAARPFTAPCTNAALFTALGQHPITTGGIFNPNNTCISYLKNIAIINNGYDSNYNGLQSTLTMRNYHGLAATVGYTYSKSLSDASDQGTAADFPIPLNSYGNLKQQLYSYSNFDIRNRATLSLNYNLPGRSGFGQMLEGWSVNAISLLQGGMPWGQDATSTDFSGTGEAIGNGGTSEGEHWDFWGNPSNFEPVHGWTNTNCTASGCLGGLPYYSGASNATCVAANAAHFSGQQLQLAQASLANFGCYVVGNSVLAPPPYGTPGTLNRLQWRDEPFESLDMSVTKVVKFNERLSAQFRAEIFNILNHPLFANPDTTVSHANNNEGADPATHPFGFGETTPDVGAGNPALGSGGPRSIQLGLKLLW